MRSVIALLMLLTISFQARAYDEDTHFYATYAMARYAGIRHDVAVRIALTAQWMDESFLSDPMSLIIVPFSGVKKRRLLHFPSDRIEGEWTHEVQQQAMGVAYADIPPALRVIADEIMKKVDFKSETLDRMVIISDTERDHRLATQLLWRGLQNGDLMEASASLHVLEDSYAHAGTPAGEGHRGFWHWPDRPFDDVPKYFDMTKSVFQALVAIRYMLPTSALDCSIRTTTSGEPNCSTQASVLQGAYAATPIVKSTVAYDALKDGEYIFRSTKSLILGLSHKKYGYINLTPQVEALFRETAVDHTKDVYQILVGSITKLAELWLKNDDPSLNMKRIMSDIYSLKDTSKESIIKFIKGYGHESYDVDLTVDSPAFQAFAQNLSGRVLRVFIPRELNKNHRMELELDKDLVLPMGKVITSPRTIEMEIRVRNMQKLVSTLYPEVNLQFVENNSKDEAGFAAEVRMLDAAKPKVIKNRKAGVEYVTFDLVEKNRFDYMIFHYLYPYLHDQHLRTIVDILAQAKGVVDYTASFFKNMDKQSNSLVNDKVRVAGMMASTPVMGEVRLIVENAAPFALNWVKGLAHEEVTTDNYDYHNVANLVPLKKAGAIQQFLTVDDTWNENMTVNAYKTHTAKIPPATIEQ